VDAELIVELPKKGSQSRTLQRTRRAARKEPAIPRSFDDFIIPDAFSGTLDGDQFYAADRSVRGGRIIIFKTVPLLFYQLYTVFGFCFGTVVPFVYALLPDKRRGTYQALFDEIRMLVNGAQPLFPFSATLNAKSSTDGIIPIVRNGRWVFVAGPKAGRTCFRSNSKRSQIRHGSYGNISERRDQPVRDLLQAACYCAQSEEIVELEWGDD
jgi:hypothetical protein